MSEEVREIWPLQTIILAAFYVYIFILSVTAMGLLCLLCQFLLWDKKYILFIMSVSAMGLSKIFYIY